MRWSLRGGPLELMRKRPRNLGRRELVHMLRIGVDIGGTYTDIVILNESTGSFRVVKLPSTPRNPALGMLQGLNSVNLKSAGFIGHGTTITTNAVIEKKVSPICLLATKGFRDILEIRRADRGNLYDLHWYPPDPLVPRWRRIEVNERTDARGSVIKGISRAEAAAAARQIRLLKVSAVAICFINSYLNSRNERELARLLRREQIEVPI